MSLTTIRYLISAFVFAIFLNGLKAADTQGGQSSNHPDQNQQQLNLIEILSNIEKVFSVLEAPCSEEGLIFFQNINDNYHAYSQVDSTINIKARRYRAKCLLTFIANLYPIWGNSDSYESLIDWAEMANLQLSKHRITELRLQYSGAVFIEKFQSLIDPESNPEFEKMLLFTGDSGSSSSKGPKRISDAIEAFASGINGYCWVMQSETFVKTNQLMEKFLMAFKQDGKERKNQLFADDFLIYSFNMYSLCKNIQKYASDRSVREIKSESLKKIKELPITDITLEESDLASGYLQSLVKATNECTPRSLISFTAIEETITYTDNKQLKDYLQYETDLAKNVVIEKCQNETKPVNRYSEWLETKFCGLGLLTNSVLAVARSMDAIPLLKAGNVGQVINFINDENFRSLVERHMQQPNQRLLTGLTRPFYSTEEDIIGALCNDFKIVYPNSNQNTSSFSYLFHHYAQHKLIAQMLSEDESKVVKHYLTSIFCQNLLGQSSLSS